MLDFRWVAIIALWTLLSGPIFTHPPGTSTEPAVEAVAAVEP